MTEARPLPPVAARVDAVLADLDAQLDWLLALSPIDSRAVWFAFDASGRSEEPVIRYADPGVDLTAVRTALETLPLHAIEPPALQTLLRDKQQELVRMVELVERRGRPGFTSASIALFGAVEPGLLALARNLLACVPASAPLGADCGIEEVRAEVDADIRWYRAQAPDFNIEVVVEHAIPSLMMVSHGRFYIDADIRLPRARVRPLIEHEIGTHVVTRHNGQRQPLRQLQVGLAGYDATQEGLGVLAEFLAGYLPGERLRILAARVIAADMAACGARLPEIFDLLHHTHDLPTDDAFDIALRARRGGGLTKDAVYLRGLRDLLGYLHAGGAFGALFIGKFALSQLPLLDALVDEGWARPPDPLPRYAATPDFGTRLARCRRTPPGDLFHPRPALESA